MAIGVDFFRRRGNGGEIERRGGNGEGVSPFPADYGVWGSVVSSHSGVRGGAPAENGFWCILSLKKPMW